MKNNSSFPLLNDIVRLNVSWWLRNRLFERTVIPGKQPNKFTLDKMQKLKWLFHIESFGDLKNDSDRWAVIQLTVLNYKKVLTDVMKKEIDDRCG
jgi:hypothetical protein